VTQEDAEVEAATDLITRMERNKKKVVVEALKIAKEIDVPAEVLLKKSTGGDAQKVVELAGGVQDLVVAGDLLNIDEGAQRSSEADASEAARGNTYSHNISDNVIEIESTSTLTSTSTSSDIDDIPLNRVY